MKQVATLALLLGLLGLGIWWMRPDYPPLPDATLNFSDGSRQQLAELRGRPLLINFWSVSCSVCLQDMPKLVKLHEILQKRGGKLVAVNMPHDPPPAILHAINELDMPYPTVLDVHAEINRAFGGIQATPTTLFVNRQGKIVAKITGELDLQHAGALLATL